MAIIKCTECGKEISDSAGKCPNCGSPTARGAEQTVAKIKIIGGVLLLIGLILLVPAFVTLLGNVDDWYFWHWDTSYAYGTVAKLIIGGILTIVGGALLGVKAKAK